MEWEEFRLQCGIVTFTPLQQFEIRFGAVQDTLVYVHVGGILVGDLLNC